MGKLKYVVKVLHNDRLLATETSERSDDLLDTGRMRGGEMSLDLQKISDKVVAAACKAHDEEASKT